MISETFFAQNHTSVWQILTPTSEIFVRRVNMYMCSRFTAPLQSLTLPTRRALLNEAAFLIFARRMAPLLEWSSDPPPPRELEGDEVATTLLDARRYLARLERESIADFNREEIREVEKIQSRLVSFFYAASPNGKIEVFPTFAGCGYIDQARGDVFLNETLYEVKAGSRPFRSVDFRQLLIYCALNSAKPTRNITNVSLVNPRTGLSFAMSVSDLCNEMSGKASLDLFEDILRAVSSGDISR